MAPPVLKNKKAHIVLRVEPNIGILQVVMAGAVGWGGGLLWRVTARRKW